LEQAVKNKNLIIASPGEKLLTEEKEININAKTGKTTLPTGTTEITIENNHLQTNSEIIIIPLTDNENQVLTLIAKKGKPATQPGWFKIGIDKPVKSDIEFSWWIVDEKP